jgi:uncharacterized protein (DUF2267 family)
MYSFSLPGWAGAFGRWLGIPGYGRDGGAIMSINEMGINYYPGGDKENRSFPGMRTVRDPAAREGFAEFCQNGTTKNRRVLSTPSPKSDFTSAALRTPNKEERMSVTITGLEAIEKSMHKTNEWLKQIEEGTGVEDRHHAFQCLRAVLQTLRNRLPVQEAVDLGDQLPLVIRGLYYENWNTAAVPSKDKKLEDFLAHIESFFPKEDFLDTERISRSVIKVLKSHVSEGEIRDVRANLPRTLQFLLD